MHQLDGNGCRELIFKHFPPELTSKECCDFLNGIGAISTHVLGLSDSRQKYVVAEFPTAEYAWTVVRDLHQRSIVDQRISVEFYEPRSNSQRWRPVLAEAVTTERPICSISKTTVMAPKWDSSFPVPPNLIYRYPTATNSILTNIVRCMISCPALYTQVLHIMNRLHLPPPFGDTDTFPGNLVVVTETDLLSRTKASDDQISVSVQPDEEQANHDQHTQELQVDDEEMELSDSSESELDSEENSPSTQTAQTKMPKPVRRSKTRLVPNSETKQKRPRSVMPHDGESDQCSSLRPTGSRPSLAVTEVFEPVSHVAKMELHVPTKLTAHGRSDGFQSRAPESGFGVMPVQRKLTICSSAAEICDSSSSQTKQLDPCHGITDSEFQLRKNPMSVAAVPDKVTRSPSSSEHEDSAAGSDDDVTVSLNAGPSLSLNDLRLGRLTEEERQNYPVFAKGYQSGEPTSRLYIKNLAARTTPEDLYRVFGAFQSGPVRDLNTRPLVRYTDTTRFSIRLLTEGRMKGQAFVSLPCELTALQALEATNGFLLHERPMVVQFARGAKAKVDEKSLIVTT
ncbi:RNA-binding protein 40 [Fasciola gigantica]|uniref:RNA-binding protein 40 n=1 Tax=Fasciola gigantica TaxID=46835 RepID=A0A504YV57_FASGI|nr:RNA-binding protein 40 [Fasciola gigantica]